MRAVLTELNYRRLKYTMGRVTSGEVIRRVELGPEKSDPWPAVCSTRRVARSCYLTTLVCTRTPTSLRITDRSFCGSIRPYLTSIGFLCFIICHGI